MRNLTEVLHSTRAEIQEWTIGRERGYTQLLLMNQRENSVSCTHIHHTQSSVDGKVPLQASGTFY